MLLLILLNCCFTTPFASMWRLFRAPKHMAVNGTKIWINTRSPYKTIVSNPLHASIPEWNATSPDFSTTSSLFSSHLHNPDALFSMQMFTAAFYFYISVGIRLQHSTIRFGYVGKSACSSIGRGNELTRGFILYETRFFQIWSCYTFKWPPAVSIKPAQPVSNARTTPIYVGDSLMILPV